MLYKRHEKRHDTKKLKSKLGRSLLPSKKKQAARATKCAWKHRFVCDQAKIPTTDLEKDELLQAGLGEKLVEFGNIDMDGEQFRDHLYSVFPKL